MEFWLLRNGYLIGHCCRMTFLPFFWMGTCRFFVLVWLLCLFNYLLFTTFLPEPPVMASTKLAWLASQTAPERGHRDTEGRALGPTVKETDHVLRSQAIDARLVLDGWKEDARLEGEADRGCTSSAVLARKRGRSAQSGGCVRRLIIYIYMHNTRGFQTPVCEVLC